MNIGDYVRTKEGYICKILALNEPEEDDGYLDHNDIGSPRIQEKHIVKSSPNIIDLIEIGDYVNGLRVEESKYGELYTAYTYIGGNGRQAETYINYIKELNMEDIYSIVTKEMMESVTYYVK